MSFVSQYPMTEALHLLFQLSLNVIPSVYSDIDVPPWFYIELEKSVRQMKSQKPERRQLLNQIPIDQGISENVHNFLV